MFSAGVSICHENYTFQKRSPTRTAVGGNWRFLEDDDVCCPVIGFCLPRDPDSNSLKIEHTLTWILLSGAIYFGHRFTTDHSNIHNKYVVITARVLAIVSCYTYMPFFCWHEAHIKPHGIHDKPFGSGSMCSLNIGIFLSLHLSMDWNISGKI